MIVVSYKVADPDWKLAVTDNGVGKPAVNASDSKAGLGTSLVKALAQATRRGRGYVSGPAARPYPSLTRHSNPN